MDDLYSILPATRVPVSELPKTGAQAPAFPGKLGRRPSLIVFLRHCGCPFSEKAFKQLRAVAGAYGDKLNYFVVSHASKADTNEWVAALGGAGQIEVLIDTSREVYGRWGLGLTGVSHTFGWSALSQVVALAWNESIYNRPTKGTRWQSSGFFAVSSDSKVVYTKAAENAADIPNLGDLAEGLVRPIK
ncbi:Predicted protein [Taphrina deformans PYCC 5710]|uniref:Thioredoxin domain-containing protein n=1 Tax=Taphrina deformans (strain PYCC 5710 / ATCC 11124 / CBS 356.35 / IMI 108563 / JCM 9778 / NBRC 8474) TaxID=1097556 RepID=R4X8L1_TAPDE|nr:Predicted protein [Taphrina deformans PYCC 5710]|eukprot:CCG81690.1 Predicted protein [Taphrina deformans PYCC 5710]